MIITRLTGGLGNQMFQYAVGRSLALRNETYLGLDTQSFKADPLRNYQLDFFRLPTEVSIVDSVQLKIDVFPSLVSRVSPLVLRRPFRSKSKLLRYSEKTFSYDDRVRYLSDNTYLVGYWQSHKYFEDFAEVIRKDFRLINKGKSLENQEAENMARTTNSISLHVRRGDYVASASTNGYHGTMSEDYYRESIKYISSHVTEPRFFVFSDDIDWTRRNIDIPFPATYVTWNQDSKAAYLDLHLMSQCKHNILANSTFSWWGAWLNDNAEKKVIYPKRWFSPGVCIDTVDLFPGRWVSL